MITELEAALTIVQRDSDEQATVFRKAIGETPRLGWSQERHDQTMVDAMKRALDTFTYCQVRIFQIGALDSDK